MYLHRARRPPMHPQAFCVRNDDVCPPPRKAVRDLVILATPELTLLFSLNDAVLPCFFCEERFPSATRRLSHMWKDHRDYLWRCSYPDCKYQGSVNPYYFAATNTLTSFLHAGVVRSLTLRSMQLCTSRTAKLNGLRGRTWLALSVNH